MISRGTPLELCLGNPLQFWPKSPSIICCSDFSLVAAGSLGFLLSCDGDLREPLVLPQGIQASYQVARGISELISRCCRGIGPHLVLRLETPIFLSSCDRDLGVPIKFQQGSQGSSHFETWNSTFLSGCKRVLRHPVEIKRGTRAFSRGATRE